MGWLAAGTGTLIAACAVYALTARYVVGKTEKEEEEEEEEEETPVQNGHAVVSVQIAPNIAEKEAVFAQIQISPPALPPTHFPQEQLKASIPQAPKNPIPQPPSAPMMAPPPLPPTIRSSSPPRLKPPTMSAPPRPGNGAVRPPPSAAASLRVPQTKVLSNTHMQPASSTLGVSKKSSRQVTLEPGYSPLDWAALAKNPNSHLRGKDAPDNLTKVTPSQLKKQTGRKGKDAWTVYQGKVYNITPYLPFHPGGAAEIMKGAGQDSARLFMEVHPWVNWDGMLGECLVGILVAENDAEVSKVNRLDEMD